MKEFMYNKNPMKVLSYLSKNRKNENLYGTKIAEEIGVNQGGTSIVLKRFKEMNIVNSGNVGKTVVYQTIKDDPLVKAFRVFENILELNDLIERIRPYSRKVILFGSCATGEDDIDSDVDIFIIADEKERIREEISITEFERKISPIIVNPLEFSEMSEKEKAFLLEIENGIELWGGVND